MGRRIPAVVLALVMCLPLMAQPAAALPATPKIQIASLWEEIVAQVLDALGLKVERGAAEIPAGPPPAEEPASDLGAGMDPNG